jgi:hypothetical protein
MIWRVYTALYNGGFSMFDSLADQMKKDEHQAVSATERMMKIIATVVIAVVVFGGLYFVVRVLEN